jgi:hypothetical protein
MGASVAGIALPEGDPGSAADAAAGLRSAAGGFERSGAVTQQAVAATPSWQGMASFGFRDRCAGYQDAADAAQAACAQAAGTLRRYGDRLEEGRERVRRLQERAEECLERIELAEARAAEAADRAAFASHMAYQASFGSAADAGAAAAAFRSQADDAWGEQAAAQADAEAWREELERLRRAAQDERELVREAGRVAAGMVASAEGGLPIVAVAAPAAPAPAPEEEDKPFWEDAAGALGDAASWTGGQVVGFGKGVGEGVVGIGEGGLMVYRLSLANALIDRDSFEREWDNVGTAAEFAWNNPGEFGKAVVNWEDLAEGRYGEWLGNIGPDAALAAATAGAGTAATRGLRGADALADTADAARDAGRAAEAARAADRVADVAGAARDADRAAGVAGGIPGGGLTEAGQRALAQGDEVVRHWTPLDSDRPLLEQGRGDTFRSSTYDEVRLSEDRVFYRDYSDPNRRFSAFWTREPSAGPFQSILDSAILPEWGNRAEHTVAIRVPAGTTVYEGPTAPQGGLVGGGDQTVIPHVKEAWEVGR